MSYIFLDESGDLGFNFRKAKTSKYFVVTLCLVNKKRPIEKVVRNIHKNLRKKYKMRDGILHAHKEESITCLRFCKKIAEKDCKIMTIYLNKNKVYTQLQNEKIILYNYIANILLDRILTKKLIDTEDRIKLIVSRRETSKFLNFNFKKYLKNQASYKHGVSIDIEIKTPFEQKGLQAVDIISWAIFRKYEYNDDVYYNVIKNLIVEENPLF